MVTWLPGKGIMNMGCVCYDSREERMRAYDVDELSRIPVENRTPQQRLWLKHERSRMWCNSRSISHMCGKEPKSKLYKEPTKECELWKVYALLVPTSYDIRYIGITQQTLEARLYQHIHAHTPNIELTYWIQTLQSNNELPLIRTLAYVYGDKKAAEKIECEYVRRLLVSGYDLLNDKHIIGNKLEFTEYLRQYLTPISYHRYSPNLFTVYRGNSSWFTWNDLILNEKADRGTPLTIREKNRLDHLKFITDFEVPYMNLLRSDRNNCLDCWESSNFDCGKHKSSSRSIPEDFLTEKIVSEPSQPKQKPIWKPIEFFNYDVKAYYNQPYFKWPISVEEQLQRDANRKAWEEKNIGWEGGVSYNKLYRT